MKELAIALFSTIVICGSLVWEAQLLDAQADNVIIEAVVTPQSTYQYRLLKSTQAPPANTDVSGSGQNNYLPQVNANINVALPEPTLNVNADTIRANLNLNSAPSAPDTIAPFATQVNLDVPFTSQAPFKKWDAIHEETCEEADIFMVDKYFKKQKIVSPAEADAAILKIIAWEKKNLGNYKDTNASEIARTLTEFYGYKNVTLVDNPTVADIKDKLSKGFLVLLPADGKKLQNPNFKNGGPPYHVLLLRGYTADGHWITNDSGTRLGDGFLYPEANLMTAMHDYVPNDTPHGRKVIVVIKPN